MERKLHLLDTIKARGEDGKQYVVHGYEHLARLDGLPDTDGAWEPTGQVEYRLESGEGVTVDKSGAMAVAATGLRLAPQDARVGG